MAKLIYAAIASLDGYVEDEAGNFDWAAPDDEVHAFVNELERPIGTYLYGRRMYETMVFWETASAGTDQPAASREFAEIWRAAEKIVYSRSLETVSSARTRIERDLDPDAVRRLKETAQADITIGGPELAGQALLGIARPQAGAPEQVGHEERDDDPAGDQDLADATQKGPHSALEPSPLVTECSRRIALSRLLRRGAGRVARMAPRATTLTAVGRAQRGAPPRPPAVE